MTGAGGKAAPTPRSRRAGRAAAWTAGAAVLLGACGDETPTSTDPDLFPVTARTVEIRLTYDEFVERTSVLGGYGRPSEMPDAVVAAAFGDPGQQIEARTLVRFGPYPQVANVRDTTGTTRPDSALTFLRGRAVVHFDTTLVAPGPVELSASSITDEWHPASATWTHAVDTIMGQVAWTEPGAGPAPPLDTATWDPAESDSVVFAVDSMAMVALGDTANRARGIRIDMTTPGERVRIRSAVLVLEAIPSINPDTVVEVGTFSQDLTFVYDPPSSAPEGFLQIGGAPSWRTVFEMDLPATISEPPEVCDLVGCPFELTSEAVIFASVLLSAAPPGGAFQPVDSLLVDARPVFSPGLLPKAPLGSPLQRPPQVVAHTAFQNGGGETVAIPVTPFIKDVLRGETDSGLPAPTALALLSPVEPLGLEIMRFLGAGSSEPPILRILATVAEGVNLP